jgi:LysM repeat protein
VKRYILVFGLVVLLVVMLAPTALAQGGGHYVQPGETLVSIAAQYGVSVEAIMRQNGLYNPDMIYSGQILSIPGGYADPAFNSGPGYGCANPYTVRPGDTLSGLAWNYGSTPGELLQLNGLANADFVYVGQRLCVPVQGGYAPKPGGYGPPPGAAPYYHTVVTGETLSNICTRYGIDPYQVIQANNLNNASVIWAGQQLIIPDYQPRPPAVVAPLPAPVIAPPPAVVVAPPPARVVIVPAPGSDSASTPPPPSYQKGAAKPLLPLAKYPVEVVVNGGSTWADEVFSAPDPNGITTVVVQTGPEFGKTVRMRSGDYEVKGETQWLSGEFGPSSIAFRYVPEGDFDVWVDDPDTPSEKVQISVDPGQRVNVAFSKQVRFQGQTHASPDGWVLTGWKNPSKPHENSGGWSNILVKTPASNMRVVAESEGGGYKATCLTGSKGPGMCDFAGLMAGIYFIHIDGTYLTLKTYMDGSAYAEFEFARQPVPGEENLIGPVNYD